MKEVLSDLAAYHLWANKRLLEAIRKLPAGTAGRETPSSFPSVEQTFRHLLWAEEVWLQRLQMKEKVMIPESPEDDFNGLAARMIRHNEMLAAWIKDRKAVFFDHTIAYYTSKKQYFKSPVYQCLLQLFNHATYHRGQVVTMLRQLGVTKIPATDYILFKRSSPSAVRRV